MAILPPRVHLAMSGGSFGRLSWEEGFVTGIWWAETRDAVQHPAVHRTVPPRRMIQVRVSIVLGLTNPGLRKEG